MDLPPSESESDVESAAGEDHEEALPSSSGRDMQYSTDRLKSFRSPPCSCNFAVEFLSRCVAASISLMRSAPSCRRYATASRQQLMDKK